MTVFQNKISKYFKAKNLAKKTTHFSCINSKVVTEASSRKF